MPSPQRFEATPHLCRALGYSKFRRQALKVIVLDSGYHLQHECARSLQSIGHTVKSLRFTPDALFEEILPVFLRTLTGFKPDFILTVNHLGFDREGVLGSLLERLQIPIAAWYVDSPFFVFRSAQFFAQDVTSTFIWDESYSPAMKHAGVQDIHYLPLAADTQILEHPVGESAIRYPILFVGDSMQHAQAKWSKRLAPKAQARSQALARKLLRDRAALTQLLTAEHKAQHAHWDTLALATFCATGVYRQDVLSALPQTLLHIIGDAQWGDVLPSAQRYPPVSYGPALANAFQAADININATSLQMPHAVNQRVFDVPAASAFLLTDAQSDIHRHFELPSGLQLYTCPQQAHDLAHFYVRNASLRQRISISLKEQIIQRHRYTHRLSELVRCMRQRHSVLGARVESA